MKRQKFWASPVAVLLAVLMLFGTFANVIPLEAYAASSSEIREEIDALEEQQAAIQEEIDILSGQLSENLSDMQEIIAQKNNLDIQIGLLYTQIATTNAQIASYTTLIADKQEVLNEAQANFDALNAQNKERIRAMEEEGNLSYWSVLFKANSFSDLLDRINMVEEIAESDRRRMEELSAAAEELTAAKEALEAEKANLETEKANLDAMQADLQVKSAEADALLDELRAAGDEFEAYMLDAEIRQYEVMLDIENLEAEYDEAVAAENAAMNPGYYIGDTTPSSGGSQDGWVCPVPPGWYFSSPFGMRLHPIWGDYRMHYGIDMSMDYGTPIYAARDGTIAGCGWNDSMGWYIWMDHNDGFETVYMHMTNFIVGYGQDVSAGEVIGYMGSTGDSTGPHLHFGVQYYGTYVNPMEYIPY